MPLHTEVKLILERLSVDFSDAVRPVLLSYFRSNNPELLLTESGKVVFRLEVRKSGAYLDVSVGEIGEEGKVYCGAGRPVSMTDDGNPRGVEGGEEEKDI